MISKEEVYYKMIQKTIKGMVIELPKTKELLEKFDSRKDKKAIEEEEERLSEEITKILISKLKEHKFLDENKEPSEKEFKKLLDEAIEEYFNKQTSAK